MFDTPVIPTDKEVCICAAIWYKDVSLHRERPINQPTNINKGIVLCGWRHGSIIVQMAALRDIRTTKFGDRAAGETIQGFLTSKNRFLNREEALLLHIENGYEPEYDNILYSEDLY